MPDLTPIRVDEIPLAIRRGVQQACREAVQTLPRISGLSGCDLDPYLLALSSAHPWPPEEEAFRQLLVKGIPLHSLTVDDLVMIGRLDRLEALTISFSPDIGKGLGQLALLPHLRKLDLGNNALRKAHYPTLATFRSLESLNLSGHKAFGDDQAMHLAALDRLVALDVSDSRITNAGLAALTALPLKRLNLAHTAIADDAMQHFPAMQSLEHLNLLGTKIGGDGLAALAQLPNLRVLNLGATKVGDAEVAALTASPSLIALNLSRTRIGDDGVAALCGMCQLTELRLDSTAITPACFDDLARLTNLIELMIVTKKTSPATVLTLRQALPNTRIYVSYPDPVASRVAYRYQSLL